ncbi:hypothetical protein PMI10_01421 [Flavobacterium sp. CF136]|nr:hypothetical protein PMI10_01421 [Flavobacterium sp. CF136]
MVKFILYLGFNFCKTLNDIIIIGLTVFIRKKISFLISKKHIFNIFFDKIIKKNRFVNCSIVSF